jgi:hypothetical protein
MKKRVLEQDPEIAAIGSVDQALEGLSPEAQERVLRYVANKRNIDSALNRPHETSTESSEELSSATNESEAVETKNPDDGLEGISPVARKWMNRNGIQPKPFSAIFSLGGDEIDLIANEVPGKNKKDKMHSVFLLKGIAAYLGSGAARFTHKQIKETCLHYGAYDSANFAAYLKSFSSDVSGEKGTGYALTPRGLARATDLVKGILKTPNAG